MDVVLPQKKSSVVAAVVVVVLPPAVSGLIVSPRPVFCFRIFPGRFAARARDAPD